MAITLAKVIKALEKAAGVKKKTTDDEQEYLNKIVTGLYALPEAEWKNLPEPAQAWSNAAADAIEHSKELPTIESVVNPMLEAGDEEKKEEDKPKEGEQQEEKTEKKAKAPKEPKPPKEEKKTPHTRHIVAMVCKDPSVKFEAVKGEMAKQSVEVSDNTIRGTMLSTKTVIKVMRELGIWNG